jgi:C4-dicarboxylate-specific signal transduction histidine kinase
MVLSRTDSDVTGPPWSAEQLDALNRLTTVARLLSTAVHEASNALQIVSGNAEFLEARPDDPEKTRARARSIRSHADQAGARLHQLVALAQAPLGPPRRINLLALAERAIDLRRYSLGRAQIAVSLTGESDRAWVLGDEISLVRLVANVILRAEEAVRGHTPAAVRLDVAERPGFVTLTVADTGDVLTGEAAAALFDPLSPAHEPGNGLAVARWLAERVGGSLDYDPAHAGGAAFVLTLRGEN